jgi:hypothetical protein
MNLYWDSSIIIDKTVDFNRTDIVLTDMKNTTAHVIDTAVPLTHNLSNKGAEKITKYENLSWK